MKLECRPDWEQVRPRYVAWWEGEYFGRAGFWVTSPRRDAPDEEPPRQPEDPIARWTDLDYLSALNEYQHRRTYYGADAFPIWSPGYPGAVSAPTFLGSPITLDLATGWHGPHLTGEEWCVGDIRMGHGQEWYDFGLRMLHRAVEESRGKCFPSIGAFGGTGDTLAALRDSNRLLYDVVDRPDLVRRSEDGIMDLWIELFSTYHDIVSPATDEGTASWFTLWAPGKFYPTHNDFSYMISPAMYREIFLPGLRRQTEYLDYTVYHVDGINAFAHVPTLCELPKLQALQILPGAGKPSPLHFMDTLRLVQDSGKNLHITLPAEEVETAVRSLSAKGLFIATSAESEAHAEELIAIVERYSAP